MKAHILFARAGKTGASIAQPGPLHRVRRTGPPSLPEASGPRHTQVGVVTTGWGRSRERNEAPTRLPGRIRERPDAVRWPGGIRPPDPALGQRGTGGSDSHG